MNLTERDRRALIALVFALIVGAVIAYWPAGEANAPAADTALSINIARNQLERARVVAARLPVAIDERKQSQAALAVWEKRLIPGDTAAQASAQLLTVFRRVARAQSGAIEMRNSDLGQVSLAGDYSEVAVAVAFDCQIEALLNLLADLTAQPELLAWRDLRINSADQKTKRLNVAMVVLARGPRRLLPKADAPPPPLAGLGGRG